DRVGLADVLEARLRLGVPRVVVRVLLARELAVRLLDGGGVGILGDTEDRVEVLLEPVLTCHAAPALIFVRGPAGNPRDLGRYCGSSAAGSTTATRAARMTRSGVRYPGWSTICTVDSVTSAECECMSASCT